MTYGDNDLGDRGRQIGNRGATNRSWWATEGDKGDNGRQNATTGDKMDNGRQKGTMGDKSATNLNYGRQRATEGRQIEAYGRQNESVPRNYRYLNV
jgi:hypothetical protein